MNCKLCNREETEGGFCGLHFMAYQNVVDKFAAWEKASNISWRQYLSEIQKNSLTGVWGKEVVNYLIEEEKDDQ